jgi:hypothetical protein
MLNELNNEEKINIIKDKIELHLKSLANGQVNFEDINLRISVLEQEIDKLNK